MEGLFQPTTFRVAITGRPIHVNSAIRGLPSNFIYSSFSFSSREMQQAAIMLKSTFPATATKYY